MFTMNNAGSHINIYFERGRVKRGSFLRSKSPDRLSRDTLSAHIRKTGIEQEY